MKVELHWPSIFHGALVAAAIALPPAVLAQVMDSPDSVDDNNTSLLLALTGVILVGMGIGGHRAAVRRLDAPLTHGAMAAIVTYVVIQGIGIVRRLAIGEDVQWLSIPFLLLLSSACGMTGGLIADHRARKPKRTSP